MSEPRPEWYVIKGADGICEIMEAKQLPKNLDQPRWGPFSSQAEAIARRVGLIRAGKCRPA
ncbi:hypothetical protein C7271_04410 [filamentous cyanobacterium CCP5]|nr:hypothetical protein C7271_04410 [filamentous cyanobacterium CCP5]